MANMNAGDFMVDWFLPILIMIVLGVLVIGIIMDINVTKGIKRKELGMKELSIKEKAERYDEALGRAKKWFNPEEPDSYTCIVESIFPELGEGEDEKMWKLIEKYVHYNISDTVLESDHITRDRLESWIEKQYEKKESLPQTNERAWLYLVSDVLTWKDGIGQYLDNPEVQKLAKKLCREYGQRLYNPVQDVSLEQNPIQRKDFISIPFGTDSELISEIVVIPDGCVATIEDNKIHIKREEKTDSTDNIEPKFKVSKWYQCTKDFFGKGVTFGKNTAYYCAKEGCLQDEYGCHIAIVKDLYDNFKLWTINDAKDGDVLYSPFHHLIWIYKDSEHYYVCVNMNYTTQNIAINGLIGIPKDVRPATKDEQTILFERIKEDGCEWDAEKKELNKVTIYESKIRE